jgi:hypothetical protein
MPGSPTSTARCGRRVSIARSSAATSAVISLWRLTSGWLGRLPSARPRRARGLSARHAGSGSSMPLAVIGDSGSYSISSAVASYVARSTTMPSGGACFSSRCAVAWIGLHVLPRPGSRSNVTSASPVVTASRT